MVALAAGLSIGATGPLDDGPTGLGAMKGGAMSADRYAADHNQARTPAALADIGVRIHLPALARPASAPPPGVARVDDLLNGIAPAVAWDGPSLLTTVGRQFIALNEGPLGAEGRAVVLPGAGRAVAPLGPGLAVVLTSGADYPLRSDTATNDTLLVVDRALVDVWPNRSAIVGSVSIVGRALDVRTADGLAYVATAAPAAIQVFDLRDAGAVREVARITRVAVEPAAQALEVADGVLWVTWSGPEGTWLEAWSVAPPLVRLGMLGVPPAGSRRAMIAVGGGRLFAVTARGVLEIDSSDPTNPRVVGPIDPETPCLTRAIDVAVPAIEGGPPQLVIAGTGCLEWRAFINGAWEVDRSATHERAFEFRAFGSPLAAGSGGLVADAHAAAGGVTEWTAVPPAPLDRPGTAACMAVGHEGVVLALAGDALWFYDSFAEPPDDQGTLKAPPARLGFSDPARCALAAAGDRVVIAADDLYTIVDTSDPEHPEAGRASRIPELNGAVTADDRRAYLAAGTNGLLIRPMDPADTIQGGVVRTTGTAHDVAFGVGHLFVADGPAGLSVYDATGEALPRHLVTLPMAMDARSLHYADGMLAVLLARSADSHRWWQGDFALAMVDVASPIKPEVLSVLDLSGAQPGRPFLAAGRVLVPAGDRLHAVDVSDPSRPHLDWTARDPVRSAVSVSGTILAALGELGLAVVTEP